MAQSAIFQTRSQGTASEKDEKR